MPERHYTLSPSVYETPYSLIVHLTNHKDGRLRLTGYHGDFKEKESFPNETKRLVIESAMDELRECIKRLSKMHDDLVPKD